MRDFKIGDIVTPGRYRIDRSLIGTVVKIEKKRMHIERLINGMVYYTDINDKTKFWEIRHVTTLELLLYGYEIVLDK